MPSNNDNNNTVLAPAIQKKEKLAPPRKYRVLLLNDDFTPVDFVLQVLQDVFHHKADEAYQIMMTAHTGGAALAGVYTFEIAETKAAEVRMHAQAHEQPLEVTLEPEEASEG